MARANRHYLPNQVWHITHRCHQKDYLLKFSKDRKQWLRWLFEAKKRYGLCVLNYTVTSNHIHLLVQDADKDVIPRSMQLLNRCKMLIGNGWKRLLKIIQNSVAVGSEYFIEKIQVELGVLVRGRSSKSEGEHFALKEPNAAYESTFGLKKAVLSN